MNKQEASLSQLRHCIDSACTESLHDESLQRFLASRANTMHRGIGFGEGDQVELLNDFVVKYINQVPDLLEDFYKISLAAGIDDELEAFLNIAIDYFLQPLEITAPHKGLLKLMDAAYLAHRLIEEVNDQFIGKAGISIATVDNTEENVVMHFLIGERLANELDLAVHYSVEMLISQNALFSKESLNRYAQARKHCQDDEQSSRSESPVRLALNN